MNGPGGESRPRGSGPLDKGIRHAQAPEAAAVPGDEDQYERLARALRFAEKHLGPASRQLVEGRDARVRLAAAPESGRTLEDVVLGIVFREVMHDRVLANEFFGYFFGDLFDTGRSLLNPRVRELMETGELVDSVVRDLWSDLEQVEFRTRGQFLSFLLRRMEWKKSYSLRSANRRKRGGDYQPAKDVPLYEFPDSARRSPLSEAEHADDLKRIVKVSARLPAEEREIFRMRAVEGMSYGDIGARFGLSANTIKKRILDIQERLRELF